MKREHTNITLSFYKTVYDSLKTQTTAKREAESPKECYSTKENGNTLAVLSNRDNKTRTGSQQTSDSQSNCCHQGEATHYRRT